MTSYRIVTLSGAGLPVNVDADGYDTRLAATAMAEEFHDGEFSVEEDGPRDMYDAGHEAGSNDGEEDGVSG